MRSRSITPDSVGAATVFRGLIQLINSAEIRPIASQAKRSFTQRRSIRRQFDHVLQIASLDIGDCSAVTWHTPVRQSSGVVCEFIDLIIRARPQMRA